MPVEAGIPSGPQQTLNFVGLDGPMGVAVDSSGDVFVADTNNDRVVELTALGAQKVLGFSGLEQPTAVAVGSSGSVYVTDGGDDEVWELTGGTQQELAFNGLHYPTAVAVDAAGDVYVVDHDNHRVVELPIGGPQKTLDFTGLVDPTGVAVDPSGDVFVSDGSDDNDILELPKGVGPTVTLAPSGVGSLQSVGVDAAGDVFAIDGETSQVVELLSGGTQVTLPLTGLLDPLGLAVDPAGDLFVSDYGANRVIEDLAAPPIPDDVYISEGFAPMAPKAIVEVPAGGGGSGQLTILPNLLTPPAGLAVDSDGDIFAVNDIGGVTEYPAMGGSKTFASGLFDPAGVAVDRLGNVFISALTSGTTGETNGQVIEVPDGGGPQVVVASGLATPRGVAPVGVAVDGNDDVFVALENGDVIEVPSGSYDQASAELVVASGLSNPAGVAVDTSGDVYISDANLAGGDVIEVPADRYGEPGAETVVVSNLSMPEGVAVDQFGDLFVADTGDNRVIEIPAGGGAPLTLGVGLYGPDAIAVAPPNVANVVGAGNSVTLNAPRGATVAALNVVPASSLPAPPPGVSFPDGIISFVITGLSLNETAKVTLNLSAPATNYYKYESGSWTDFSSSANFSNGGSTVTLTLTADSSGTIVDPGGPALVSTTTGSAPVFSADTPPLSTPPGELYTYGFVASGTPTYSLASGAPSWLTIDPALGTVTGTPPPGTTSFTYSVTATDSVGPTTVGPFAVTVSATPTTTTVSSSADSSTYGQSVTFTASVSSSDGGGSVAFFANGSATPISGCATQPLADVAGSWQATCATSSLPPGVNTLAAAYSGDGASLTSGGDLSGNQDVTPAPLVVTASSTAMTYGGSVPTIAAGYSGFVNDDSAASLSVAPTCSTTATDTSPVSGSPYPSSCSGAIDPNYAISFVGGAVTVNPAVSQFSITLNGSGSASIPHGDSATLAESGLPRGASGTVVMASGSTLLCSFTLPATTCPTSTTLGVGSYPTISAAFRDTDGNYMSSPSTNTVSLTVASPSTGAPQAVAHHYWTPIGDPLAVSAAHGVLANDTVNGASIISHTNPSHGNLALRADGSFAYSPQRWFVGVDSFTYTLGNSAGQSTATVTIDVPARADLSVALLAPSAAGPGSTFSYTVVVTNAGPDPAQQVDSGIFLPPGVRVISATPPGGDFFGYLYWSIPTLAPGASVTYGVMVRVTQRSGTLHAAAYCAASGSVEPNPRPGVAWAATTL